MNFYTDAFYNYAVSKAPYNPIIGSGRKRLTIIPNASALSTFTGKYGSLANANYGTCYSYIIKNN